MPPFVDFEEKYAEMQFATGTMHEPAKPSAVAGRYEFEERRNMLSTLVLVFQNLTTGKIVILDQTVKAAQSILSERKIAQAVYYTLDDHTGNRIIGWFAGVVAKWTHKKIREWETFDYDGYGGGTLYEFTQGVITVRLKSVLPKY